MRARLDLRTSDREAQIVRRAEGLSASVTTGNRCKRTLLTDLILRSDFPEPPGADFVAAFREHVRLTASPETFEGLSSSPFPSEGRVEILFRPVSVNQKARGGSKVPCPICSARKGKWLSGGTLIWCEATRAVYLIGPDCYTTLDGGERVSRAINAYNVEQEERRRGRLLADIAGLAPDLIAWADAVTGQSRSISATQVAFAKSLPRVRRAIHNSLKASPVVRSTRFEGGRYVQEDIGRIGGAAFLTGQWDLVGQLNVARRVLKDLSIDAGSDHLGWADALAPSVRKARLAQAQGAVGGLIKTRDKIEAASAFLSPESVRVLALWSRNGAPTDFRAEHTATRIKLMADDQVWEAPVGLTLAAPLPQEAERLMR